MTPRLLFLLPAAAALSAAISPPAGRGSLRGTSELNFALDTPSDQPEAGASLSKSAGLNIAQASDGLFYVQAKVNSAKIHFVVDSGASVVVLTPGDAARIGLPISHAMARQMQTSGGNSVTHAVTIGQISVAGQAIRNVDAVVVDSNLKVSLLGQSALTRLRSVNFEGKNLHLD